MNDIKETDEKLKKLVIARLGTLPANVVVTFGSPDGKNSYTRKDLIKNINENTEIGQKVIEMQLTYLKLLKENVFYAQ